MGKLTHTDYYHALTEKVLALMAEHGTDWVRPWTTTGMPHNPASGTVYSGSNTLWLWMAAERRGFDSPIWSTYRGWQTLGGQVRKGADHEPVVFWKIVEKRDKASDEVKTFPIFRTFQVFNIAEVEGVSPEQFTSEPLSTDERNAAADVWFEALGADLYHGGDRAFYMPSTDTITMPMFGSFTTAEAYYATLGHEHIHWTGHKSRTGRLASSPSYAFEELVAELGAAFLCAFLGLSPEPRPDHAKYLNHWIQALHDDPKAIYTASSQAAAAVRWMHAQQEAVAEAA